MKPKPILPPCKFIFISSQTQFNAIQKPAWLFFRSITSISHFHFLVLVLGFSFSICPKMVWE